MKIYAILLTFSFSSIIASGNSLFFPTGFSSCGLSAYAHLGFPKGYVPSAHELEERISSLQHLVKHSPNDLLAQFIQEASVLVKNPEYERLVFPPSVANLLSLTPENIEHFHAKGKDAFFEKARLLGIHENIIDSVTKNSADEFHDYLIFREGISKFPGASSGTSSYDIWLEHFKALHTSTGSQQGAASNVVAFKSPKKVPEENTNTIFNGILSGNERTRSGFHSATITALGNLFTNNIEEQERAELKKTFLKDVKEILMNFKPNPEGNLLVRDQLAKTIADHWEPIQKLEPNRTRFSGIRPIVAPMVEELLKEDGTFKDHMNPLRFNKFLNNLSRVLNIPSKAQSDHEHPSFKPLAVEWNSDSQQTRDIHREKKILNHLLIDHVLQRFVPNGQESTLDSTLKTPAHSYLLAQDPNFWLTKLDILQGLDLGESGIDHRLASDGTMSYRIFINSGDNVVHRFELILQSNNSGSIVIHSDAMLENVPNKLRRGVTEYLISKFQEYGGINAKSWKPEPVANISKLPLSKANAKSEQTVFTFTPNQMNGAIEFFRWINQLNQIQPAQEESLLFRLINAKLKDIDKPEIEIVDQQRILFSDRYLPYTLDDIEPELKQHFPKHPFGSPCKSILSLLK